MYHYITKTSWFSAPQKSTSISKIVTKFLTKASNSEKRFLKRHNENSTNPAVRMESTNPDQMSPTNSMSMNTIEDELIPMWNKVAIPRELNTKPKTPTVGMTTAFVATRAERHALLVSVELSVMFKMLSTSDMLLSAGLLNLLKLIPWPESNFGLSHYYPHEIVAHLMVHLQ